MRAPISFPFVSPSRLLAVASIIGALLFSAVSFAADADWPRFRGPNGAAVSRDAKLPTTWSDTENLLWKSELPGFGSSSPIVLGNRVYLTYYSGYGLDRNEPGDMEKLQRHLRCVKLSDGSKIWDTAVASKVSEDRYRGMLADHGYATSTPATDGERIYVFYGKTGVLAFDLEGKQLWQTGVGTGSAKAGWGSGTSVVLYKNLVIVNANAESQAIIALDKATGKEVWKTETKGYEGSWSTPILVEAGGRTELAINMPGEIWGLDPNDGGLLWYSEAIGSNGNTSLVAKGDVLFTMGGGPGGASVAAVRAGGKDDVTKSHLRWKKPVGSYVPSPVVEGDDLYWVDDKGVAYCLKTETGEQLHKERISGAGSTYASILSAGGHLYVTTRRNGTYVLDASSTMKQIAHNKFSNDASDFNASPAVAGDRLLVRSNRYLYCIGNK